MSFKTGAWAADQSYPLVMSPRRVAVIGYDGSELLDLACITTALDSANRLSDEPCYSVEVLSPGGRPIGCDSGLSLRATGSLERATGPFDTVVVSGGMGHEAAAGNPVVVGHVRRLAQSSRRVASVCTGATVLAACGLLEGKRATTHWQFARQLARQHPEVTVDASQIYIRERDGISTAAGVTSALDLMLAFIAEDHGELLSGHIARALVTYLHRPGNQAQVSMFVASDPPDHQLMHRVVDHIRSHVGDQLDIASLAKRFGVSERQLNRLFQEHIGMTPGRFVRCTRAETAAGLLTATSLPVGVIAARCGFGTAEGMRQVFVRQFGIAPARYRSLHTLSQAG